MHDPDLTPLTPWQQRRARLWHWWRTSKDRRRRGYRTLGIVGQKLLTLAISVLGATLISYGVWLVYVPAGFVTGGFMAWLLLWSNEKDRRGE